MWQILHSVFFGSFISQRDFCHFTCLVIFMTPSLSLSLTLSISLDLWFSVSFLLSLSVSLQCFWVNIILSITYKYQIRSKANQYGPGRCSSLSLDLLYKLLSRKRNEKLYDISVISSILCKTVLIQRARWIFTLVCLCLLFGSMKSLHFFLFLLYFLSRVNIIFRGDISNCKSTTNLLETFNVFNWKPFLSSY